MFEFKSVIFIPGGNEKMLSKATSLDADLVLFDLEDAVHENQKDTARTMVAQWLSESKPDGKVFGVRLNALDSKHLSADLAQILPAKPDLIMLPKVESGQDLKQIDDLINRQEAQSGLSIGSTKLMILTAETPASLLRFDSLFNVSDRLVGMTWGAEDLASELGAAQGRDKSAKWLPPFQLAQTLCLAKASDLGVQALDTVMADFKNLDALRQECLASKEIGYTGKLAIHPAQLDVINEVFSPSEQEIEFARRVIELFESNPNSGALQLDGAMVDIPHLRSAKRLLARIN